MDCSECIPPGSSKPRTGCLLLGMPLQAMVKAKNSSSLRPAGRHFHMDYPQILLQTPFVLWLPAAVYLGLEGRWGEALGVAALGSLLVRGIENFLYPVLVRNRLKVPSVSILVALNRHC